MDDLVWLLRLLFQYLFLLQLYCFLLSPEMFIKINKITVYMKLKSCSTQRYFIPFNYGNLLYSFWRRANARNVRLYYPYWQYTDHFIFWFVSLLCLRSTLCLLHVYLCFQIINSNWCFINGLCKWYNPENQVVIKAS